MDKTPHRNCAQILWHKLYSVISSTREFLQLEKLDALVAPFASEPAYCRCQGKGWCHLAYKFPDHSLLHVFCIGSSAASFDSYEPRESGCKSLGIRRGPHGFELDDSWSRTQHVTNQLAEEWSGKPS